MPSLWLASHTLLAFAWETSTVHPPSAHYVRVSPGTKPTSGPLAFQAEPTTSPVDSLTRAPRHFLFSLSCCYDRQHVCDRWKTRMTTVIVSVQPISAVKERMKAAFAGKRQESRISFASLELLWKVLAPNRMALVQAMTGAGPMSLREAARRVDRDVRAVHADVHTLLNAGVLDKLDDGRIEFPYTAVHVDFMIGAAPRAAPLADPQPK